MYYAADEVSEAPIPLTGSQAWYFAQNTINPHHFNISLFLEVAPGLDLLCMKAAVEFVICHHDTLRMRFRHDETGWSQFVAQPYDEVPFNAIDLSMCPETEQRTFIETEAQKLVTSLDLFSGPVLRVAFFDLGASRQNLLFVTVHHQVADEFSIFILLRDLEIAYQQLRAKEMVKLSPITTSLKDWTTLIAEFAQSDEIKQDLIYWLHLPWSKTVRLPVDYPEGRHHNTIGSTRYLQTTITIEETKTLLRIAPRTYKVQTIDVLLTALVQAFSRWTGSLALQVSVVHNGRNTYCVNTDIDLLNTMGNMLHGTEHLVLELKEHSTDKEQLQFIHQQFNQMPHGGFSDDWLLYFCKDTNIAQKMRALPNYEVVFNYHGQNATISPATSQFRPTSNFHISGQHPENPRSGLISCQVNVIQEQFHITWIYSENIYLQSTIEKLAFDYNELLRAFCQV